MVAALLLGPIITLLALGPALTDSPVNLIGPPAIFVVGLAAWYLISVQKINAAIQLSMTGIWVSITDQATSFLQFLIGVLQAFQRLLHGLQIVQSRGIEHGHANEQKLTIGAMHRKLEQQALHPLPVP